MVNEKTSGSKAAVQLRSAGTVGRAAGFFRLVRRFQREGERGRHSCAIAVLVLATVCGAAGDIQAQIPAEPHRAPEGFRQFTDEMGRRVSVPQPVQRVVSLAPSLTETVYALGLQAKLVGVTDYCDYPPAAQTKPKVGGAINPNLEQIVALKPDLVLVTKALNRRETAEALERLSVAAYATDPRTVEDVLSSTARLADVMGARALGEALVARLRARLEEIKRLLRGRAPRRVLFVVWQEPLISIGRETFLADALRWAGAESIVETAQDWPRVNLEEVLRLQPEFLVFSTAHAQPAGQTLQALRDLPGWRNLQAVREKRVVVVSDAVNRPAPRLIDAIEQLARHLHPEAFAEKEEKGKEKQIEMKGGGSEQNEHLSSSIPFLFSSNSVPPATVPHRRFTAAGCREEQPCGR